MDTYPKVVRFLKKHFPAGCPLRVLRLPVADRLDGECRRKDGSFLIRISNRLPEHEAIETLLHEYAHVVAWDRCPGDEHCDEWGKAYSRIYRAFLREFLDGTPPPVV